MTATDLPNTTGTKEVFDFDSHLDAWALAKGGHAACRAGYNGCILIWADDQGVVHATFYRYHSEKKHSTFKTQRMLMRWLVEWLPQLQ